MNTGRGASETSLDRLLSISSQGGDADEAKAAAYLVVCNLCPDPQHRDEVLHSLGLGGFRDQAIARLQDKLRG